jgi:hypothetical protein
MAPEDRLDGCAGDVDDRLLEGREHDVLLGPHEQGAHHRLDLGTREFDTDVRGHRRVRAPARKPAHLANERVAQIGVLKLPTVEEVTWPCSRVHVGVAGS